MELRQLRYFVVLAEERHFGRAAERLHIAQPGLSQQIKALERSVSASLFDREARPVALTEAGLRLLPYAKAIIEAATRAAGVGQEAGPRPGPILNVGLPTFGHYPEFLRLLRRFTDCHPDVDLRLVPSMTQLVLEALERRSLDVGLVHAPFDWAGEGEEPRYVRLGDGEMLVILPVDHPLASQDRVAREQLLSEPFILAPAAMWPRLSEHVHRTLFGVPWHPRTIELPEAIDHDWRIRLVANGKGLSALTVPEGSEPPATSQRVVYRRVSEPPALLEYGLVWLDANASPVARSFVELAGEHADSAVE